MKKTKPRQQHGDWKCEEDVLCAIKKAQEKEHLSIFEDEHFITITAPERVMKDEYFDVRIEVGRTEAAPAESSHFIEWIELYADDTFLGRTYFSSGMTYPETCFKVKLSHARGPLKAWAKCNMHGLWAATGDLEVKQ